MYPNLKLQLWRKGIRQNRLAVSLGIDESLLSRIVNGYREAPREIRLKIASMLQMDEAWLFEPMALPAPLPENGQEHQPSGRNGKGASRRRGA